MPEASPRPLFELLPPPAPVQPSVGWPGEPWWLLCGLALVALAAVLVAWLVWRRSGMARRHRLRADWRRGRITSRELLHRLARAPGGVAGAERALLDRLRFSRHEPETGQVLAALRRAGGRGR